MRVFAISLTGLATTMAWSVRSPIIPSETHRARNGLTLEATPQIDLNRRHFVGASLLFMSQPSRASASTTDDSARLIQSTSSELTAVTQNLGQLEAALAAENSVVKLPSQVPLRAFQQTEKQAHDVDVAKLIGEVEDSDGFMPAEDFLAVAAEYAEHAGAARDLAKLAKLGRVGENGSEEVAKGYAKRCVAELKAAGALLTVLAAAITQ
mmetsp:Transcript_55649/g.95845  ORF Transcript_55649/g.95845 Transcript_55649/m.95845 type:complete len:209 (-) Transcript_55649:153-779(-)